MCAYVRGHVCLLYACVRVCEIGGRESREEAKREKVRRDTLFCPNATSEGGGAGRIVSKKGVNSFLPLFCGNVCVRGQSSSHSVAVCGRVKV